MRWTIWIWLPVILLAARGAEAAMETEEVRSLLEKMQAEEAWGEAVLTDGRVRSLRVEELEADSVAVVEVVGALQEREAAYALAEIRSLRSLGEYRIQARHAAYQQSKSGLLAFLLELPVPGAGYFYIGEHKQGLALMGMAVTAVGTAVLTGADTAAGWVPLSVWVKIASLAPSARPSPNHQQVGQERRTGGSAWARVHRSCLRLKLDF